MLYYGFTKRFSNILISLTINIRSDGGVQYGGMTQAGTMIYGLGQGCGYEQQNRFLEVRSKGL
jgi:hypothetical protein